MLYSLAIFGSECASEFVKNVFSSNSDIWSARNVSALSPNSIAGISIFHSFSSATFDFDVSSFAIFSSVFFSCVSDIGISTLNFIFFSFVIWLIEKEITRLITIEIIVIYFLLYK